VRMEGNKAVGGHHRIWNAHDHGDSHRDRQGIKMNLPLEIVQFVEVPLIGHNGSYADADIEANRQQREYQTSIPEKFRSERNQRACSCPHTAPAKELYNALPHTQFIAILWRA